MAKPKSPLISLGATGTIGDILTYQKRGQCTIARKKPIPAYRYTLPQAYQRWLYEDYAYLWTQQSEATRRQYAATGSRYHLTGFQSWMKYQLTNLSDIAGYWKLDKAIGATTPDSSRNTNTGTIFGASPATGIIDKALSFDGINDYVDCGNDLSLNTPNALSILLSFKHRLGSGHLITKGFSYWDAGHSWGLAFQASAETLGFSLRNAANDGYTRISTIITLDTWYHLAAIWTGSDISMYLNGSLVAGPAPCTSIYTNTLIVALSRRSDPWFYGNNLIDNVIIYNRALDITEINRHSLRRYPP